MALSRARRIFRRIRKIAIGFLLSGVIAFVNLPWFVSDQPSGTLDYRTAAREAGVGNEFLYVDGVHVHVNHLAYKGDCGCAAPLIVMLHGFAASNFTWRDIGAPLTSVGEVVEFERPGYGFTERPTKWSGVNPYGDQFSLNIIQNLIDRFGAGREVILVGHSAGGTLAAQYALAHPKQVSKLVLIAPAVYGSGGLPDWAKLLTWIPQIQHLGPILVGGISASGDKIIASCFVNPAEFTEQVRAGYHAPLVIAGWERALWQNTLAPRNTGLTAKVSGLETQVLLITGDRDGIVPTKDSLKLAKVLPNVKLLEIPRSGHLAHEEFPGVVVSAIEGFLG